MKKILVTGANGQVGTSLKNLVQSQNFNDFEFYFVSRNELDIADSDSINLLFDQNQFDYCINCAAYTAVDLAETEIQKAFEINAEGVKNLAIACKEENAKLIHISTDYVFDGNHNLPYKPIDKTNPINVYGKSKLQGEIYAMEYNPKTIIIRTSWVYAKNHGKNFYTTMVRLMQERDELNIVSDQIGKPTNADNIAKYILELIQNNDNEFGIRNFAGDEIMSWFEFAQKIATENKFQIKLNPITTEQYPTPAKRPKWSVLE